MRWLKRTLLILLPMVIILVIGGIVLLRSERVNRYVRDLLTEQLTQSINREVEIKSAKLVSPGLLRLDGVQVAGETPQAPPLLRARTITISFGWRSLVLGRQPALSTIERITVTKPEANVVRRPDGRWEIVDLLKPRKPGQGRFRGVVKIARGRATVSDYAAPPALGRPALNHFDQVSASIMVTADRTTLFSISGRGEPRVGLLHASGVSRSDRVVIDATVRDADLPYVWRYLNVAQTLAVEAGRGDARTHFASTVSRTGRGRRFDYVVDASIRDSRVRLASVPALFDSVSGKLMVAPDHLGLSHIRGTLGRSQLEVDGTISRWRDPVLLLRVRADDADPADLLAATPGWALPKWIVKPKTSSFDASISGPWRDPEVQGTARWGAFGVGPARWSEGRSPFRYRARRIEASDLVASGESGSVRGKGWISWAPPAPRAAFEATVSGAAIGPLAARLGHAKPAVSGLASGSATIAYDAHGLRMLAPVAVTEAKVDRVKIDRVDAVARYDAGSLDISGARVHTEYGDAFVEGGVQASGGLSLLAIAGDIELASLPRLTGVPISGGRGYALAHVGGTLREPSIVVLAGAVDAEIKGEKFGLLTADLAGDANALEVIDARAWWRGGEIRAAGEVRDLDYRARRATLDLGVDVAGLPLAELAASAKRPIDAVGIVSGHLDVAGSTAAPEVTGEVMVERPIVAGQVLDSAYARGAYRDRTLDVKGGVTVDGRECATVTGTVDTARTLALTVTLDDYPLRELPVAISDRRLSVSGALQGSGTIEGTLSRPDLDIGLRAPQLTADGQVLHDVVVSGAWAQDRLTVSEFAVGIDDGGIQGSGVIETAARRFEAHVSGQAIPLARLLGWGREGAWSPPGLKAAAQRVPRSLEGALSVQADFEGAFDRPTGHATVEIADAQLAGYPLPALTARAELADTVVTLDELTATEVAGPAEAKASGTVDLAGDVKITVDAHNINAGLFAPWLRDGPALGGSADISADISGPVRAPVVRGSIEVAEPRLGVIGFEHVQVAMFTIDEGQLSIPEDGPMLAVREGRTIAVWGTVAFAGEASAASPGLPVDLHLRMPEGDLSMVASLVPGLASATGPVAFDLRIAGTLGKPRLEGSLTVADGRVEFVEGVTPLVGLKASILFEGDRIRVAELTGSLGGGRVWVEPGGTVQLRRWSLTGIQNNSFDLLVRMDRAELAHAGVGSATVTAELPITNAEGGTGPAQIGGKVTVTQGTASALPAAPELAVQRLGPLPFDPGLDVALHIDPNLAIRTSAMSVVLRGDGRLGGRLSEPDAVVTLAIDHGNFSFPAATFGFREGLIDVAAMTGEPVRATITADAEARVRQYHVYLHLSGPLTDPKIDMQSVPYLSDEEILALLTGREISPFATTGMTPQEALQSEFRTLLTAGLRQTVLGPVEREFAESIGLSELTFEFGPYNQPVVVRAGTFLGDRFYLQHVRSLGGAVATSLIRASYEIYLNPPIWLGWSVDERQTKQWELETHFRF